MLKHTGDMCCAVSCVVVFFNLLFLSVVAAPGGTVGFYTLFRIRAYELMCVWVCVNIDVANTDLHSLG